MKKFLISLILSAALLSAAGGISGCAPQADDGKLDIICTIFPQYDWVRNITDGDENVNLTVLQTSGTDLHNYQPSFADTVKIYNCDVFVYVGGESDQWAEDILSSPEANPDMLEINLLNVLGDNALAEEEVPGAEGDHDEHADEEELDEHIWLSLKNAKILCGAITDKLSKAKPESEELYRSNFTSYSAELDALETEFSAMVGSSTRKTILFADRFPFRYLTKDYGLSYFAAFSGCSAETEASFEVIDNLVKAVNEHSLPYIIVLEGSDKKIANTIIASSAAKNQEILAMNSIQSVTKAQIQNGASYLSLMQDNLAVLRTALN